MSARKIVLVHIDGPIMALPLALGNIAAYTLADKDIAGEIEFRICHLFDNFSFKQEVQSILETDPYIVGFSTYSWNFHTMKSIARAIKEFRKDVITVFGGAHVSSHSKMRECLGKYPFIDFIIDGEGEEAFLQLIKVILDDPHNQDRLRTVPNLSFRYEGEPFCSPVYSRISDLDRIPSPYLEKILKPHPLATVVWETNRGCPYRCAYCYWGNCHSKITKYSVAKLKEELLWFAENKVHSFYLADANFGILQQDKEIAEMLCQINNDYGRPFKSFIVTWAKKNVAQNIEIAETFKRSGIESSLTIAYQTFTPEAREIANRESIPLEQGKELLQAAKEKGIPVYTDLIWGLPGESYSEFLASLEKAYDMGIQNIYIFPLEINPGTRFYEEKDRLSLKTLVSDKISQEIVLSHPGMSIEDQQKGVRIILVHHLFHTFKTFHIISRYIDLTLGIKYSSLCEMFLDYLEQDRQDSFSSEVRKLSCKLLEIINGAGARHGAEIDEPINLIAYALWDHWGLLEELFTDFYCTFLLSFLEEYPDGQQERMKELLRFNLLVAPKPGWFSKNVYPFTYDVGGFYHDLMEHWIFPENASRMPELKKRPCMYRLTNSFYARPHITNTVWIRNVEARMCMFEEVSEYQV